jgi:hypothetical protein
MPEFRLPVLRLSAFLFGLAFLGYAWAGDPPDSAFTIKPLPGKHLESVYRNGDLDSVVIYIRMGRPRPVFLDKNDSTLAFKYLGIIYSADPQTREKGRYYFNQLLKLDPKASITELIPGENARTVFKEAREEFYELHPKLTQPASPAPPPEPAQPPYATTIVFKSSPEPAAAAAPGKKRSYTWLWVTGGVVAAGAAAAAVTVAIIDPPAKTYKLHD